MSVDPGKPGWLAYDQSNADARRPQEAHGGNFEQSTCDKTEFGKEMPIGSFCSDCHRIDGLGGTHGDASS
jgi:hypothetical protein